MINTPHPVSTLSMFGQHLQTRIRNQFEHPEACLFVGHMCKLGNHSICVHFVCGRKTAICLQLLPNSRSWKRRGSLKYSVTASCWLRTERFTAIVKELGQSISYSKFSTMRHRLFTCRHHPPHHFSWLSDLLAKCHYTIVALLFARTAQNYNCQINNKKTFITDRVAAAYYSQCSWKFAWHFLCKNM